MPGIVSAVVVEAPHQSPPCQRGVVLPPAKPGGFPRVAGFHIGWCFCESPHCESLSHGFAVPAPFSKGAFLCPVSFYGAIPGFYRLSIDSVGRKQSQTRRVNLPMVPPGGFLRGEQFERERVVPPLSRLLCFLSCRRKKGRPRWQALAESRL